ncbi:MAG: hypothetical protein LBT09_03455 [Planctomycetaceae bacterium]|nr:hypothetical protein [Planctomycetaceae bacterium]
MGTKLLLAIRGQAVRLAACNCPSYTSLRNKLVILATQASRLRGMPRHYLHCCGQDVRITKIKI